MIGSVLFLVLTALSFTVIATPLATSQRSTSNIASNCTNPSWDDWALWYSADCLADDGKTLVSSATYLGNKISTSNGKLIWQRDASDFLHGCISYECKIVDVGILSCDCETSNASPSTWITSTIDLSEHIQILNGHLLSNLKGTPRAPTQTSSYPVPKDIAYYWQGNSTAYACLANPSGACFVTCDQTFNSWALSTPQDCYLVPGGYLGQQIQYNIFELITDNGWEVSLFADGKCAGTPVKTIGPGNLNKCVNLGAWVTGLSFRPLFNADF